MYRESDAKKNVFKQANCIHMNNLDFFCNDKTIAKECSTLEKAPSLI